ncbi:uncharacterized protein LOC116253642 [Nymphaea colorata]|uniref:uncharacterized protein LOC116253642 n=1 Tax=Nymphaea colorata TaxID=210225 RepID=UPI00129DA0D1|nr:uncharacterized protein LOC116253642 [Nymphaea colorata]
MERAEGEGECTTIQDLRTKRKAHIIIRDSFRLILADFTTFLPTILLASIPIFLLLFFSLSVVSLRKEISYKESLLPWLPGGVTALHVKGEIAGNVRHLLKYKAVYWLPTYVFSVMSTVTTIKLAASSNMCQKPKFRLAMAAVRETWWRLAITSLYVTVFREAYDQFARVAGVMALGGLMRTTVGVVVAWGGLLILRVYIMVVLSMGMVVSVLEGRWGLEAVGIGWELVEERRLSGWILGGFQAALSYGTGWWWCLSGDRIGCGSTSSSSTGTELLLVGLLSAVMVVLSDVLNTIYYFDCKMCQGMPSGGHREERE